MKTPETNPLRELLPFLSTFTERASIKFSDLMEASDEERKEWVLNYCRLVNHETNEVERELPWKWWKKNQSWDKEAMKKECVDVLLSAFALCQIAGFDPNNPDELWEAMLAKHQINHSRQDNGY